ncbi:MAG: 4'-phosphopantetheinyl transferase superfamily protein [Xenococcus sp. MO_188.B8]|nr:4'-phosphopantetheinyl transferase superfamily protein [Xenococcus sp. MO_188.B8]
MALYGFTYQRIIGVDLEYIKDNIDYKQLAKRFFTTQELQLINSYPAREQKTIFFQLWTAKEAYLKATGDGLAASLDTIEFTLDNNSELNLVAIKQDQAQASYWLIDNFIPQDNFVATIAVKNNSIISDSIATKFFEYR